MLYLDANILIIYLTNTPEHQGTQVRSLFRELANGTVHAMITEGVLVEVTQVLTSRKGLAYPRELVSKELKSLLEFRELRLEKRDIHMRALDRFGSASLDYVDCILIELAHGPDDIVVSFDRAFDRALPGIRKEPDSILQQTDQRDMLDSTSDRENEE